jgi:iron complex outermembrane recepter protein
MLKEVLVRLSVILLVCGLSVTAHAMADQKSHVNVPAGDLTAGLEILAKQSGAEFVYSADRLKGLRTHGVAGDLSVKDAVNKLLEGTTLQVRMDPTGAMLIVPPTASPTAQASSAPGDNGAQEGKSKSSGNFLLAQVDQGQTSGPSTVEKQDEKSSEKRKGEQLQEVIVTGSRIPQQATEAPQDVQVFTRDQIELSGQPTVAEFLNTLPSVSLSSTEHGQVIYGGTTVQLRGLPYGTTLVLIDGRRVETSGAQSQTDTFDLNNIPLAAVERIEVVPDGSSAIYGSDAIAGVVNIILRKDIGGFEANEKFGAASDTHEWDTDAAWGKRWDNASLSIVGSYQTRTELAASERSITADSNYIALGGPNRDYPDCHPGNVFSVNGANLPGLNAPYAAVPAGFTGTPSLQEFRSTAGTLNECSLEASSSLAPAMHRAGAFLHGTYSVSPSTELFTEVMYSRIEQFQEIGTNFLFGIPGFQQYTVAAQNPYNPFGTTVGIADALTSIAPSGYFPTTNFFRPLVGARGDFLGTWHWEVTARVSKDSTNVDDTEALVNSTAIQNALNSSNPATALNPFTAAPEGPASLLESFFADGLEKYSSVGRAVDGFARGSPFNLPAGPVQLVLGTEYDRDSLSIDYVNDGIFPPNTAANYHRTTYAFFGEARVPVVGNPENPQVGESLAITLAGRHDHYNDFGAKNTPQYGVEWRPLAPLLIRASYAEAFKAPSLADLFGAQGSTQATLLDPLTGQPINVTLISGGNPNLRPETGDSRSLGFLYSTSTDLKLSATYWEVKENNTIAVFQPQLVVDNANLFPGQVIRAASCPSGPPCPITTVIDTSSNFGSFDVKGIDYQGTYRLPTRAGTFSASINATQTVHYLETLVPGAPAVNALSQANDSFAWAPRWKGAYSLSWSLGHYAATFTGRYVGRYQDYDSTREIGDFWLYDANLRYALGPALAPRSDWLKGSLIEIGGINLFDTLPQFSNYSNGFLGYDPTQADIRGRFLYARIGWRW